MAYSFELPAIPYRLYYRNDKGVKKIFYFDKNSKIICYRDKLKTIGIKAKNIGAELYLNNIDKFLKIEYIRNEKKWKKYHGKLFLHHLNGSEEIIGRYFQPNYIRIKGNGALWGYQKIKDEEVE